MQSEDGSSRSTLLCLDSRHAVGETKASGLRSSPDVTQRQVFRNRVTVIQSASTLRHAEETATNEAEVIGAQHKVAR